MAGFILLKAPFKYSAKEGVRFPGKKEMVKNKIVFINDKLFEIYPLQTRCAYREIQI